MAKRTMDILVVDDDDQVRAMIADLLEEGGHRVNTAPNAKEAAISLSNRRCDLVITDLDLPDMSGWQLARKIREMHPHTVIGLITGWPLDTPQEDLRSRSVQFVLSKPFSVQKLWEALDEL